jgi:hypothetical protein
MSACGVDGVLVRLIDCMGVELWKFTRKGWGSSLDTLDSRNINLMKRNKIASDSSMEYQFNRAAQGLG